MPYTIIPFRVQYEKNIFHLYPKGYNYISSATPNRLLGLRRNTINNFAAKHCNTFAAKHCSSLCLQSEGDEDYCDLKHFRDVTVALTAAKHCSSLCLQSEGDEDCGELIAALSIFATCPWPSLRRSIVAHFARKVRGPKIIANL